MRVANLDSGDGSVVVWGGAWEEFFFFEDAEKDDGGCLICG